MKNFHLPIALFALMILFPCCSQHSDKDKTEAKNIYSDCNSKAELWLHELDKTGYSYLNNLKLSDLAKEKMTDKDEAKLQNYIIDSERTFGKVQERKFFGAHFWLHDSLLTYFPGYDKKVLDRMGQAVAKD